jgi:hypothetical protein
MLFFESLLAHLAGDYLIQSEALVACHRAWRHVWGAVPADHAVSAGTGCDRGDAHRPGSLSRREVPGLARNLLAPTLRRVAWADVQKNQGSPVAVSSGLANALVIIADNTVHLAINAVALAWWG